MSADSVQRQKNFCDKENFNFPILSDENKEVIKAYKAWGVKKMYGREYEGILDFGFWANIKSSAPLKFLILVDVCLVRA